MQCTIHRKEPCTDTLKQLALSKLTKKQKVILMQVLKSEGTHISDFVVQLKQELDCSDSILWKSIRTLRETKLLSPSKRVSLTETGRFLLRDELSTIDKVE